MKKSFITIVAILLFLAGSKGSAMANTSNASAQLQPEITTEAKNDHRVKILEGYLNEYNSPLATHARSFIESADKYDLDWKLLVSIAGLESSYGKHIPQNSHNGWGWGYNNGSVKHFENWDAAIEEISKGLRENYLFDNKESDPYIIGPKYAASPTWAQRVTYFMNKIEDHKIKNAKSTLKVTI